jgi:hypothetical protein
MMAPPSQELEPPANPERFTTPEQAALGRQIIHNGGEYIVARSIDDVQASGL